MYYAYLSVAYSWVETKAGYTVSLQVHKQLQFISTVWVAQITQSWSYVFENQTYIKIKEVPWRSSQEANKVYISANWKAVSFVFFLNLLFWWFREIDIVFFSVLQRHLFLVIQLKLSSPMNCGWLWWIQQKEKKDTLPLVLKISVTCQGHHLYAKNYGKLDRDELMSFTLSILSAKKF